MILLLSNLMVTSTGTLSNLSQNTKPVNGNDGVGTDRLTSDPVLLTMKHLGFTCITHYVVKAEPLVNDPVTVGLSLSQRRAVSGAPVAVVATPQIGITVCLR